MSCLRVKLLPRTITLTKCTASSKTILSNWPKTVAYHPPSPLRMWERTLFQNHQPLLHQMHVKPLSQLVKISKRNKKLKKALKFILIRYNQIMKNKFSNLLISLLFKSIRAIFKTKKSKRKIFLLSTHWNPSLVKIGNTASDLVQYKNPFSHWTPMSSSKWRGIRLGSVRLMITSFLKRKEVAFTVD